MSTDIFNLNSKIGTNDGENVVACLVINKFNDTNDNLINKDAEIFKNEIFPNETKVSAGPDMTENEVTTTKYNEFIKDINKRLKDYKKISAFGIKVLLFILVFKYLVLYISSHGRFGEGGKSMFTSDYSDITIKARMAKSRNYRLQTHKIRVLIYYLEYFID